MLRKTLVAALVGLFLAAGWSAAAEVPVATAAGVVGEKPGKDSLTVRTRSAGGRFGPTLKLKVTGTSNAFTIQVRETKDKKTVIVQVTTKVTDLKKGQPITVLYVPAKGGGVLLCAVAQPASK
jgi:hypothetical protein